MTPTIRLARSEDAAVLEELERECFADPSWSGNEFMRYRCAVAEVEGRIAGFVVIREVAPGEHEILNLAVAPVFRRLGVARALLRFELAPSNTYFLEVRESNIAARKLYERLGFIEVGSRPDYYDNPPERAIVMRRK